MIDVDPTAARRGVYTNERASALAGVPRSTMYYWARQGLLAPSISAQKLKLWSWADLVALRAIYWLRHPAVRESRRATPMRVVRSLVERVEQEANLGEAIASGGLLLYADTKGTPHIETGDSMVEGDRGWRHYVQRGVMVNLLSAYPFTGTLRGPDLVRPREGLRIIPGKLAGEPHVEGTRIETRILWALHDRGFGDEQILTFYPDVTAAQLAQAVDLEHQLQRNLHLQAA
jgi:uncharacterized protein (DUF433 family)